MNSQDFRNLQEAYLEVYQELDEGLDKRFASMRKRGGASAPPEERSVGGEMNRRTKDYWADTLGKNRDRGKGSKAKRRASALNTEEVDIYDIILSYLLDEGYADTKQSAEVIMVNMSEEWREEIMEGVRPTPVTEPLDKTAFKKRRRSLAGKEASHEARKRGHEGKTWADTGRTYSPDEAKSRRKNMSDTHRSLSYGTAESPDDNEGYPAVKTKNPKKLRKQKAMGEHG